MVFRSQPRVQLKLNPPKDNKTHDIEITASINTPNIVTQQLSDNIPSPRPSKTQLSVPNKISPTKSQILPINTPSISSIHIIPPDTSTLPTTSTIISRTVKLSHEKTANIRKSKRKRTPNFKYQVLQYLKSKYSTINSYLAHPVIDPNTGASLEFRHLRRGPDHKL